METANHQNRIRNLLAVIRTIVRHSAENSTTVEEFAAVSHPQIRLYGKTAEMLKPGNPRAGNRHQSDMAPSAKMVAMFTSHGQ